MTLGRPIERDRKEIADKLLEWAKKEDSTNLNGFCISLEPPLAPTKLTLFSKENDYFREAYDTAKAYLAQRRERMLSNETLHVKAYDLNASVYDYFLKQERIYEAEHLASLKAKSNELVDQESMDRLTKAFSKVDAYQNETPTSNPKTPSINPSTDPA